ncbi:2Fe-2S iron-sulfur cluster-binding protein, partial [Dietzia cinnamea]
MRLTLRIWRQSGPHEAGRYEEFEVRDARPEMSVLELLDVLNGDLVDAGIEPVAFDSDCREGICGACGVTVDGRPHGPAENTPSCHQRLTPYADGDTLRIEPLRAAVFPVIRDLVVDRSALDGV